MTGCSLVVLAPGPLTTVQDEGRPGLAALGVGRSGCADRGSATLANRLLGNRSSAAVLELTLGGLRLRAGGTVTVALTGAQGPASIAGVPVPYGSPLTLPSGAELVVTAPDVGLRSYLAVRGGIEVTPVLGSRSYDVLARLGPPPLVAGAVLPVGGAFAGWPGVDVAPVAPVAGRLPIGAAVLLSGSLGPHADALATGSAHQLRLARWSVGSGSDRTGLRLTGAALSRSEQAEWPVEGLVRGAVQLPPSGEPVVMLADHPVTGGYPAIGVLDDTSCDLAAQLRPGDGVTLRLR